MDSGTGLDLDDWSVLVSFLPEGWREAAVDLGAMRRLRKVENADMLLRLLLIHLAEGCSLRETVAMARTGGLVDLSDVALLKRLSASGDWLRWLCVGLMTRWFRRSPGQVYATGRPVVVVDGSTIKEPGPTGSTWRLHYALELATLHCRHASVTDCHTGESLSLVPIEAGDILVADRGYGRARDVRYAVERQADVIVRFHYRNVRLRQADGQPFPLLRHLKQLSPQQVGDWDCHLLGDRGWSQPIRVCAVKMSKAKAEEARQRLREKANKARYAPSAEALAAAGFITVLTTLPGNDFSPSQVLEIYRGRWQVELVFKRMKSIIELGHLHKTTAESIHAWIHGKLFVALLIEAMIVAGEAFFPWGYPLEAPP